ncbi:MAG: hypothetical protein HUK21_05205 [Fibrobacteraceae bacterium]|nr:hypothetical protein [Fibrobacteraceae bacterium]
MKYFVVIIVALFSAFIMADLFFAPPAAPLRQGSRFFRHQLHGENIGLECAACHQGAEVLDHAYMPSKSDCLACHRLPLTEGPMAESLDSAFADDTYPFYNWNVKSKLPEHVVFHHGVHAKAKVSCEDCHGSRYKDDLYGGEKFTMKFCTDCHQGKTFSTKNFRTAAVYCGACHR